MKRPILISNFVSAVQAAELHAGTESRALRWRGSSCGGLGHWINISLLLRAGPSRAVTVAALSTRKQSRLVSSFTTCKWRICSWLQWAKGQKGGSQLSSVWWLCPFPPPLTSSLELLCTISAPFGLTRNAWKLVLVFIVQAIMEKEIKVFLTYQKN